MYKYYLLYVACDTWKGAWLFSIIDIGNQIKKISGFDVDSLQIYELRVK